MKKSNTTSTSNRSILNFFKPASSQQQTSSDPQPSASASSSPLSEPDDDVDDDISHEPTSEKLSQPPAAQSSGLKSGKTVIEDSEDEDSESDLEDMSVFLGKKPAAAAKMRTPPRPRRPVKVDFSPIPERKFIKNNLAHLVEEAKKERAERESREKALKIMEAGDDDSDIDPEELGRSRVLDGDEDERVRRAIKRQEAADKGNRWFFFNEPAPGEESKRKAFPLKTLRKSPISSASKFRQTVVGDADYVTTMGEELPEELLLWTLDEICFEHEGRLRDAYSRVITCHSSTTISRLMNPEGIEKLFQNLGATEEATITSKPIGHVPTTAKQYQARSWKSLISLINLLGSVSRDLSSESRHYSFCLLARLCMDSIVGEKLDLYQAIRDSFKLLIESIPQNSWESELHFICQTILGFTELSTLRYQILSSIPDEGNYRLKTLRHNLALAFFSNNLSMLSKPLSLPSLTAHLSTAPFKTNTRTDYKALTALIHTLNIAVGNGYASHSTMNARGPKTETEATKFNENIDGLVEALTRISSTISDASAGHPSRNVAKMALKIAVLRIGSLRTKKKPRENIWDWDEDEGEQLTMEKFLVKFKEENVKKG